MHRPFLKAPFRPIDRTHLDKTDSTFCAKFMIMNVPCNLIGKQQLGTQT